MSPVAARLVAQLPSEYRRACNHMQWRLQPYETEAAARESRLQSYAYRLQPHVSRLQPHVARLQPYSTCCRTLGERRPGEARHTADDIRDRRVGHGHRRLVLVEARGEGLDTYGCSLDTYGCSLHQIGLQPPRPRRRPGLFVRWGRSLGACGVPPAGRAAKASEGAPAYSLLPTTYSYYALLATHYLLPGRWPSRRPWREVGRGWARRSTRTRTAPSRPTTATFPAASSTW